MKINVFKAFNGPAYTRGAFEPGKPRMKICQNCGRRIGYDADKCEYCNAEKKNGWKPEPKDDECDLKMTFTSGGGYFRRGEIVSIRAKNGCMSFTSSNGNRFVKLEKDFFLCTLKKMPDGRETIYLIFSDFTVNMTRTEITEQIIIYIYSSIVDRVYERKNCFYNATHDMFPY